jgi:hypothetical protein
VSVAIRVLAPAVTGEQRCHFLVQWRDSHAIQHSRTFSAFDEAAAFDAAIKAEKLPRDAAGRRAAVTFGTARPGGWRPNRPPTGPARRISMPPSCAATCCPPSLTCRCPRSPAVTSRNGSTRWPPPGLAPATVLHAYRAVYKSVLNDAIDDGLLARSPCHRIELPAAPLAVMEPLTRRRSAPSPAGSRPATGRCAARRRMWAALSEAAGLTRDRVHLGAGAQITIDRQLGYRPAATHRSQAASSRPLFAPPKTEAASRVIPLPATVTAALRAHLRRYPPGPDGLLFTTPADHEIQRRLGHAHPGEIRWYRHPDPGDSQATRDAIDAALTAAESGREQAAAC